VNQLFLLRHAKSSWSSNYLSDFDRPLNNRGRRNAVDLGELFFEKKLKIDHVMCSPSARTRETFDIIQSISNFALDQKFIDSIYHSSVGNLIEILSQISLENVSVLIVGHNPSMHLMTELLVNQAIDKFPTCTLAQIKIVGSWDKLRKHQNKLINFRKPKK
jgi:phosphohistidine phosphatase